MTFGAQARGSRGSIVYGRVRDILELRASAYPVFALGTSTVGQSPYTRASQVQVPVTVNVPIETYNSEGNWKGLPTIKVNPGDTLVADIDGVVCVPKGMVEDVIKVAKAGRRVDEKCADDIKKGVGVAESFRRHRGS